MDYIYTSRSKSSSGTFTDNPGVTRYLKLPSKKSGAKKGQIVQKEKWIKAVLATAKSDDIVIYVHGFNTTHNDMLRRHRKIRKGLSKKGYRGAVISFDWPSDGKVANYSKDRADAQKVCPQLVLDGIVPLLEARPSIRIHILAHSMGSLVVRHGFTKTTKAKVGNKQKWKIAQVMLVAADIDARSFTAGNSKYKSLVARCAQLTNYYSWADEILNASNWVYWGGTHPRLGFEGAPDAAPSKAVGIYCQKYYIAHKNNYPNGPSKSHTWYFDEPFFYQDVSHVLADKLAPAKFPTRVPTDLGNLALWKR